MLEKLKNLLLPLIKPCLKVHASPSGFLPEQAAVTRFGGPPYAEDKDSVPLCAACNSPLSFVFQFKAESGPDNAELLQFFYCFNCSPWGGKKEEGQWLVRTFSHADTAKFVENPSAEEIAPCLCRLEKVKMLPDFETLEESGSEVVKICEKINKEDPWDVYEETCMALGCEIEPFSSIGGYPIWIQGHVEKNCPECKKEMDFITQIDSVAEAQLMWGDAGCVYLFRCRSHPHQFALEMQCF